MCGVISAVTEFMVDVAWLEANNHAIQYCMMLFG
jgi:hypothetical protein